jgi:hypothetical protein
MDGQAADRKVEANSRQRTVICVSPLSSASLPPWILASDDMPEPSAQWRPVLAAVSDYPSSDQILVGQSLARNSRYEAIQPLQRVPLHIALVEVERELVYVAMQVLVDGIVIEAMQTALQDSPTHSMLLVVTPSQVFSGCWGRVVGLVT